MCLPIELIFTRTFSNAVMDIACSMKFIRLMFLFRPKHLKITNTIHGAYKSSNSPPDNLQNNLSFGMFVVLTSCLRFIACLTSVCIHSYLFITCERFVHRHDLYHRLHFNSLFSFTLLAVSVSKRYLHTFNGNG